MEAAKTWSSWMISFTVNQRIKSYSFVIQRVVSDSNESFVKSKFPDIIGGFFLNALFIPIFGDRIAFGKEGDLIGKNLSYEKTLH